MLLFKYVFYSPLLESDHRLHKASFFWDLCCCCCCCCDFGPLSLSQTFHHHSFTVYVPYCTYGIFNFSRHHSQLQLFFSQFFDPLAVPAASCHRLDLPRRMHLFTSLLDTFFRATPPHRRLKGHGRPFCIETVQCVLQ